MAFKLFPYPCNENEPFACGVKYNRLLPKHPFHECKLYQLIVQEFIHEYFVLLKYLYCNIVKSLERSLNSWI